jgi:hypothetical protein
MVDGRAAAAATMTAPGRQRLVVALGGNALLKRGEPLTFANQVRLRQPSPHRRNELFWPLQPAG